MEVLVAMQLAKALTELGAQVWADHVRRNALDTSNWTAQQVLAELAKLSGRRDFADAVAAGEAGPLVGG